MLKWVVALAVVVLVLGLFGRPRWLGRLPGDLHFRFRGREYAFPFASTLLLSLLATLLFRYL
jgi:hypothetical protein